jgi:hypothetical protein
MRHRLFIGFILLLAAIVANYAPLLNTHSKQDDCTFGSISNASYRGHLARARAQLAILPPSIFLNGNALALKLDELFANLGRDETNIYARLAIMHATLRAAGAEYRNANGNNPDRGRSDPFLAAMTETETISFNYFLDINRLGVFSPWPRDAWVIASLAGPRYARPPGPLYPKKAGGITFIVYPPDVKMWPLEFEVRRDGECPPLPAASIAENFSLKLE